MALALGGCGSSNDSSPSSPSSGGSTPQTYSLISTISGLNSNGLTLAFNNSTVSVASGATSVILASALASGTAYTVNVQAQPAGETCSVAFGAGTIAAANVANVVVTCSDQAYTLGGTLSGLNGSGLILANGADTLPISSGVTTFAMPAQVAYTASYDVTVKTQPAGLACSVSHGQGTMPASAVSDVAVSCTDQPFSVSGTISGLGSNTGLVLVNGSDTLIVSAGATSFAMPAQTPFASSYNVAVQSSPTGFTCSVANGNGTMGAAIVTNVAVTCSDQSYSLGGTISGLTQSNLVLGNGSDTISVSSGTSTFTMPTQVAYTSSYNVHVVSQPSGLTCSVSNGIGLMPADAVANVAVNCSVNTYTIGGAISGLTATGLVLLNNGGDATPIAANAIQFTMHTGVALGGTYAITAQTQPTDQTCTINNAGGSPVLADVWSIAIACAPWTYTASVLHAFGASGDGVGPRAGLIQASDGNFYGTTAFDGVSNNGTVFKITPTGVETALHTFGATGDGTMPLAGLIQASDGNFYGTTAFDGASNNGTVFKITPTGVETVLHTFGASGDGTQPLAGLVQANDGNFYGTTYLGGANNTGTVFKITPAGVETVLYSFGASGDGTQPLGSLIQASDGNFYGTTYLGGANNTGTVFKITPAGVETVLYSFGASGDGATPYAGLIQASDGNFYGTTYLGGANNTGTVFKITPAGVETVLYSFGASGDGATPYAGLVQASDGNFYGTTNLGGTSNNGTVFRITPGGLETVLYSFGGDGANPADIIQASDGNFYGTTRSGGANSEGTVFEIVVHH